MPRSALKPLKKRSEEILTFTFVCSAAFDLEMTPDKAFLSRNLYNVLNCAHLTRYKSAVVYAFFLLKAMVKITIMHGIEWLIALILVFKK